MKYKVTFTIEIEIAQVTEEPRVVLEPAPAMERRQTAYEWASEEMGDLRVKDIKPSTVRISHCSVCGLAETNVRTHPHHNGRVVE